LVRYPTPKRALGHRVVTVPQAVGEMFQLADATGTGRLAPIIQPIAPATINHVSELKRQAAGRGDFHGSVSASLPVDEQPMSSVGVADGRFARADAFDIPG
jgi:hypothetical protein